MSRQQIQFPVQQVQIAKPANPPSGSMRLYPKSDGNFYKLDSAGVEAQVGSVYTLPDPLTIGRINLTGTANYPTPALQLAHGGYISTKDSSGNIKPLLNTTGDNYNTIFCGTAGLLFTNHDNTTRLGYLYNDGTLAVNRVTANSGQINGGFLVTGGRLQAVYADASAMNTAGQGGQFEVQSTTSGAAMIAFHRSGAYASHFGIDTDNQFKIGGWSMGAVAYRILTVNDMAQGATANSVVQRLSDGGIQITSLYMPTGAQGGKPAYVCGQTGDGYVRWWPASAIGPPANAIGIGQAWGRSGDWNRVQVGAFQLDRVGYWVIVMVGRMNGGGGVAQYWLNIDGLGDVTYGDADSSGDSSMYATIGAIYYYNGLLGPNNWIRTLVANANNDVTGTTYAYFLATQAYPN